MFLQFSSLEPEMVFNAGTMKSIIKEFVVIEDTWLKEPILIHIPTGYHGNSKSTILKFTKLIQNFLNQEIQYEHTSTTKLNTITNNSSLVQKIMALHWQNNNVDNVFAQSYDFGVYSSSTVGIPVAPGGFGFPLPVVATRYVIRSW